MSCKYIVFFCFILKYRFFFYSTGTNPSEITQNDSTNELEENRSNENGNNYDDDVENDDNEEEWDEEADEQEPISCLFCADVNKTVDEAIAHMNIQHSFDLGAIKNRCSLDQYSYIKVHISENFFYIFTLSDNDEN